MTVLIGAEFVLPIAPVSDSHFFIQENQKWLIRYAN